jgi:rhomboid protease GluP
MRPHPRGMPVTLGLMGLNGVVFALMLASGAGFLHAVNDVSLAWGAGFGPATQDHQWWRLFTAMFVHFGVMHLGLNLWALWDIGRVVERAYGSLRIGAIYVVSGLVGNLASLVVQGNQAISGGASGAIFGLYGALIAFLWRERKLIERGEFRWFMGASALFPLLMLVLGVWVPEIDNAAHAGGLLAGALLGYGIAPPWDPGRSTPAYPSWWSGLLLTAGVLALLLSMPAPLYRFGEEAQAREAIQRFLQEERKIHQRWEVLMNFRRGEQLSFDQLAEQVDQQITTAYQQSFEQLSVVQPVSAVPSQQALTQLQAYAALRAAAASKLAEGLRAHDQEKIDQALAQARNAAIQARNPSGQIAPAPP